MIQQIKDWGERIVIKNSIDNLVEDNGNRIKLPDLVMLQMMGALPEFLNRFNNGEEYQTLIDNIGNDVTTKTVFMEIVNRSIENQFGEPLIALRELVQNGMDSYNSDEKKNVKLSF